MEPITPLHLIQKQHYRQTKGEGSLIQPPPLLFHILNHQQLTLKESN